MHLLGHHLPDHKLVRVALTSFYGISDHISSRLLSRLQIHHTALVSSLTEPQVTALSAYLSSPSTTPPPAPITLAGSSALSSSTANAILNTLKIETDLRRNLQADIGHQRTVGTYRGRRHAMGLPARGQNTRSNAKTAKKLNRVERRHFSFAPRLPMGSLLPPIPSPPSILALLGRAQA
ncbi:small subunit ribosomal protein S13, partial [Tremellales sp. Uapishka_1]